MHGNMPTPLLVLEGNKAGMPHKHLDGDAQDALQQRLKIELFGHQARNLEQVIPLANAKIRQHGSILLHDTRTF